MIDIHAHILPGLDDGACTWEEAREMALLAVADGIKVMVATPHLFPHKMVGGEEILSKPTILAAVAALRKKLAAEKIDLEILPGCDAALCVELEKYLAADQVLTINDNRRYLLLELPDTAIPPALEDFCFRLQSQGLTPIITHPERHGIIQETPQKLARLIQLNCLVQVTAQSLIGGFGRRTAKVAEELVRRGFVHVIATDAHNARSRPPLLRAAVEHLAALVGPDRAWAMVTAVPERIIRGEPCFP